MTKIRWPFIAVLSALLTPPLIITGSLALAPQEEPAAIKFSQCNTDKRSGETVGLSTYGNTVYFIDRDCRVILHRKYAGPMAFWSPSELAFVRSRPIIENTPVNISPALLAMAPNGVESSWPHHEFIGTPWGTYLTIAADQSPKGERDDLLVEFDEAGNILARLSLNMMIFGEKWGAQNLGVHPIISEDWLHTNSIDALEDGTLIVSTRNINTIQIIDWPSKTKTGEIGGDGVLSLQHHAKFQKDGTIRVYDNGVGGSSSSIVDFDMDGTLLERQRLPFRAVAYGSVHELSNGNWLTVDGTTGEVFEFSPDLSETYMHATYDVMDWIPFLKRRDNLVYRAYPVTASGR